MNPREMRLLIVLLAILGTGGMVMGVYQWFLKPLDTYNKQIRKLSLEIEDKRDQYDMTRLESKQLLDRARMMSLSPNHDVALAEYINFLAPVVNKSGLEIEDFRSSPEAIDPKSGQPNAVKPGHRTVNFQLRAKGELGQLVYLLQAIQTTPLVHRVKTLSIDRVDPTKSSTDKLNINMKIEALMVGRAEQHVDGPLMPDQRLLAAETLLALRRGPTGFALLSWVVGPTGPFARQELAMHSGYRQYGDMDYKNIFRGGEPPPKKEIAKEDEGEPEDNFWEVADYIRLDTADPDNREAYLRNLIFKANPIRLRSASWSPWNTFKIYANEFKSKTIVSGKVLRIDQRDVYFQVKDEVYGIHLGQSLGDAMRRTLSSGEMDRLELTKLYDAEWAEKEAKAAKDAAKQGQTAKKKQGKQRN
jgi:hypothetical protein